MLEYTSFSFFFLLFLSFHMQQPVYFICIHIFLYGYVEHVYTVFNGIYNSPVSSVSMCVSAWVVCVLWCIKWEYT